MIIFVPMFTKEQVQAIRTAFWTSLGRKMRKRLTADGRSIKWLNYKTGVKDLYFRMEADKKTARFCIDLQHSDSGIRALFYEQFEQFKSMLEGEVGQAFIWEEKYYLFGNKEISRIYIEKQGLNMFLEENWDELHEFFMPIFFKVDSFWCDVNDVFKELAK